MNCITKENRVLVAFTLLVVVTGCGTAAAPTPANSPTPAVTGPVDRSAELIDCEDYPSPDDALGDDFVIVTVPLVVTSDGTVDNVGPPRSGRSGRREILDRAVSLARSCVFAPAIRDGHTVPDRIDVQFRLGLRGGP